MSLIKLKTKEEIKDFFRILAEESIKEAKKEVFSDDPMASRISRLAAEDKKAYGIKEQGASSQPSVTISRSQPEEDVSPDINIDVDNDLESNEESEDVEDVSVVTTDDVDIEDVSLDAIEKKINALRGGRSLKDRDTADDLGRYFDLLSQAERKALYAFLTALSSMMTGASSGDDADDPSEPPYNVTMTTGTDIEVEDSVSTEFIDNSLADETEEFEEDALEPEDQEDEDVPIRVGAVQEGRSISNIRNKVQELLKRS